MSESSQVTDELLANIAVRVQLPPSMYEKAIERYGTIAKHLDREGSPLHDKVTEVYTQGSIAIGATIRSVSETDEDLYDVDLIAEITGHDSSSPSEIMDILYESIRGKKGSIYYDCTEHQTRCITVQYSDMHVDITPMIRPEFTHHAIERAGVISHATTEAPHQEFFVDTNSHGLAKYINENVPMVEAFSESFSKRALAYDQRVLMEKADVQPAPEQKDVQDKSVTIVALQLIKRHMQILWHQNNARGSFRKPPNVMLARLAPDYALGNGSLTDEVIHLAISFAAHFNHSDKVVVLNPKYEKDELTDRWPEDHRIFEDQKMLSVDMQRLGTMLEEVKKLNLVAKRKALEKLFGEIVSTAAYDSFYKAQGYETKQEALPVFPKKGRVSIITGVGSATKSAIKPPSTTSWGSD